MLERWLREVLAWNAREPEFGPRISIRKGTDVVTHSGNPALQRTHWGDWELTGHLGLTCKLQDSKKPCLNDQGGKPLMDSV